MLVELGTRAPSAKVRHDDPQRRPIVVYSHIPDTYSFARDVNTEEFRAHLTHAVMHNDGVTNFEGSEALLPLTHPGGIWREVSSSAPQWVWSDDKDLERFLSEYHQVPAGRPLNYDGDYWRRHGLRRLAPGVLAASGGYGLADLITNVGITNVAYQVGGNTVGATGKATTASSTTLTTASTFTTNQWANAVVYVADTTNNQIVYGNVISNTNASGASVLTVDQWYNAASPGGAAATTPATGFEFIITFAIPPAWFVGITTTNITPSASDTSLSGEATANGMGRKIGSFTVTSAASGGSITYTVSAVFTFTGSGATTFYALGLFPSIVKSDTTDTLVWETSFSGSATVTNSGDTLTVTDTQTAS